MAASPDPRGPLAEPRLAPSDLDAVLAIQLTVAWAGEQVRGRLGWWRTELTDPS